MAQKVAMQAVSLDFATGCGVNTVRCSTRWKSNARSPAQANPIGTTFCRPGPAVSHDVRASPTRRPMISQYVSGHPPN